MPKGIINVENLQRIGKSLPRGTNKKIATKLGFSELYVSNVRRGLYFNRDIIMALIEEYESVQALNKKLEQI